MGKVSLKIKTSFILAFSITYSGCFSAGIYVFFNHNFKTSLLSYFLFAIVMALSTSLLVFLNQQVIKIYHSKTAYLYLLVGIFFYWFFFMQTGFYIFLSPLFFILIAMGANRFQFSEDRKLIPHLITLPAIVVLMAIPLILYSKIEYLMPYKFRYENETFIFVCVMSFYLGMHHFFHVLFNLKNIAARMHCKK